jgi:hypothetical protein
MSQNRLKVTARNMGHKQFGTMSNLSKSVPPPHVSSSSHLFANPYPYKSMLNAPKKTGNFSSRPKTFNNARFNIPQQPFQSYTAPPSQIPGFATHQQQFNPQTAHPSFSNPSVLGNPSSLQGQGPKPSFGFKSGPAGSASFMEQLKLIGKGKGKNTYNKKHNKKSHTRKTQRKHKKLNRKTYKSKK